MSKNAKSKLYYLDSFSIQITQIFNLDNNVLRHFEKKDHQHHNYNNF